MTVRSVLQQCAVDLLDTEDRVNVDQIVWCARRNHPETFAAAIEETILRDARSVVRDVMRRFSENEGNAQLPIPGLGLPSVINVGDSEWVRTDKATWTELMAGRDARISNVERAQARLDAYDEGLQTLRPHMERHPKRTVADAMRRMIGEAS